MSKVNSDHTHCICIYVNELLIACASAPVIKSLVGVLTLMCNEISEIFIHT